MNQFKFPPLLLALLVAVEKDCIWGDYSATFLQGAFTGEVCAVLISG